MSAVNNTQYGLLGCAVLLFILLLLPFRKKFLRSGLIEEIIVFSAFILVAMAFMNPLYIFDENLPANENAVNNAVIFHQNSENIKSSFVQSWTHDGCGYSNQTPPMFHLTGGLVNLVASQTLAYKLLKLVLFALLGYSVYFFCAKACQMLRILSIIPGLIIMLLPTTHEVFTNGNLQELLSWDCTVLFWSCLVLALVKQLVCYQFGAIVFGCFVLLSHNPGIGLICFVITIILFGITITGVQNKWNAFSITLIHTVFFIPAITAFYWLPQVNKFKLPEPGKFITFIKESPFQVVVIFFLYLIFFFLTRRQGSLGIRSVTTVSAIIGLLVFISVPGIIPSPEKFNPIKLNNLIFPTLVLMLAFIIAQINRTRFIRMFSFLLPVFAVAWIFFDQGTVVFHKTSYLQATDKIPWEAHVEKIEKHKRFWDLSSPRTSGDTWLNYLAVNEERYPVTPLLNKLDTKLYLTDLMRTPDLLALFPESILNVVHEAAVPYIITDPQETNPPGKDFDLILENNAGTLYKFGSDVSYMTRVSPISLVSDNPEKIMRFFDLLYPDAYKMIFIDGKTVLSAVIESCSLVITDRHDAIPANDQVKTVLILENDSEIESLFKEQVPKNILPFILEDTPNARTINKQMRKLQRFFKPVYEPAPSGKTTTSQSAITIESNDSFVLVKETFHPHWSSREKVNILPTLRGFTLVHNPGHIEKVVVELSKPPLEAKALLISLGGSGLFIVYFCILWIWERKARFKKTGADITLQPVGKPQTQDPPSQ